jgi:hypothetical protein
MINAPNSKLPIRLWIKRKIEKAGWNDKELCYAIGNRKDYILFFTDGAILVRGRLLKNNMDKTTDAIKP